MQDAKLCVEVVQKLSGRSPVIAYKGAVLPQESLLFERVLQMRMSLYIDLLPDSDPSARKKVQQLLRTILSLEVIDVEQYADSWKALKEDFLGSFALFESEVDHQRAFKQRARGLSTLKWIGNSVVGLIEGGVRDADVIQWLVFDEKLNLRSLDLTAVCYSDYVSQEEQMRKWQYEIAPDLQQIADDWMSTLTLQLFPFRPKHGSGATAELSRRQATEAGKNACLVGDERLLEYLQMRYASADTDQSYWFFGGLAVEANRTGRVQCVPKSLTKNRTISAEPTTLQFLQQDLFAVMDDWFSSGPLRRHVHLHDQRASQDLCLKASRDGRFSTIDLSSASDSVTVPLVRSLFRESDLCDALMSTRSTHVIFNDTTIELTKYGGMGNGTTFPVESTVFSMLCEAACRRAGCDRPEYLVYGDDIILPTEAVDDLLQLLEENHFTVNVSKSYFNTTGSFFREACGMWALNGTDITPLRLSRRLYWRDGTSPSEAAGWLSLYNDSLRWGYLMLRRCINDILRATPWFRSIRRVPYFEERGGKPWVPSVYALTFDGNDTNWQVPHTWNRRLRGGCLFHHEAKCLTIKATTTPTAVPDENRYFSYWIRQLSRSDLATETIFRRGSVETPSTADLSWVRKWLPVD